MHAVAEWQSKKLIYLIAFNNVDSFDEREKKVNWKYSIFKYFP
jgi:hypothetical protein